MWPIIRPRRGWVASGAVHAWIDHRVKVSAHDRRERDIKERKYGIKKFYAQVLLVGAINSDNLERYGLEGEVDDLQPTV